MTDPFRSASVGVAPEYRSLNQYLRGRFADSLVLTFAEIESLLGRALPDDARRSEAWWASPAAGDPPSAQACSWLEANRTAMPNLDARIVMFDRAHG
jgi:hypothetical protein